MKIHKVSKISIDKGVVCFEGDYISYDNADKLIKYNDDYFYVLRDTTTEKVLSAVAQLEKYKINKCFVIVKSYDFVNRDYEAFESLKSNYFSWFVLYCLPSVDRIKKTEGKSLVEIRENVVLSESEIKFLKNKWDDDFIQDIIGDESREIKNSQLLSFEKGLRENRHNLYLKNEVICGHANLKKYIHPLLKTPKIAVHQWVNKDLPSMERRQVHSHFFNLVNKANHEVFCGIALQNIKSIRHFLKNGFQMVYLTVKRKDSY